MKRKELIGWFVLGYNSTGQEERSHWNEMRESKGEQVREEFKLNVNKTSIYITFGLMVSRFADGMSF